MKRLYLFGMLALFLTSCIKQEPIAQAELTGIWKLNGYQSSLYKVEFTQNGYAYWWNYRDWFNHVEEFEVEYDINRNTVYLYQPGQQRIAEQFRLYRQRNGEFYFSVPVQGTDADGNPRTGTDTYYRMR